MDNITIHMLQINYTTSKLEDILKIDYTDLDGHFEQQQQKLQVLNSDLNRIQLKALEHEKQLQEFKSLQLGDFGANKIEFDTNDNFLEVQKALDCVYNMCMELIKIKRALRDDNENRIKVVSDLKQLIKTIKQLSNQSDNHDCLQLLKHESMAVFKQLLNESVNDDQLQEALLSKPVAFVLKNNQQITDV